MSLRTERLRAPRGGAPLDAEARRAIERAAEVLRAGGLCAFPTETVYGLGARADDEEAVRRIFAAKGRSPKNPLIVHVGGLDAARAAASAWPEAAERLGRAFWPGPLTLVVPRGASIAASVTAGGPTLALRVPAHPVALALLEAAALPIAAPSANRSSRLSPTTADHVLKMLEGRIDVCLDAGPTGLGIESTIVDVTRTPAVVLRAGALPAAEVAAHVALADAAAPRLPEGSAAPAPGAYARHYAPEAEVVLAPAARALAAARARAGAGRKAAVMLREGDARALRLAEGGAADAAAALAGEGLLAEILPDDPAGYAAGLYAALHRLEDARCSVIAVGEPPDDAAWAAVRDRLFRAAAA